MTTPPYEISISGKIYRRVIEKQYYMHREDQYILGRIRSCASTNISPNTNGCPAVWVLNDDYNNVEITKYWQFYLCVINEKIPTKQVMAELGWTRALANGTGYGKPNVDRANWITGSNLTAPNPLFDKDRTMSRAMLSSVGGIVYHDGLLFRDYKDTRGGKKIYRDYIVVRTFDGHKPPPMKAGKRQPESFAEAMARKDDYLHHPKNPDDWDLFFALNIINTSGLIIPFGGGAYYDWYFNAKVPVCFFPHISNGVVKYPLELLETLPLGTKRICH